MDLPSLNTVTGESETLKFPLVQGANDARGASSSRRVNRRWYSREERKTDKEEYDIVLVPSDGVGVSGSESDDSDYSVGWLEPHAAGFLSDDDTDNSFAVLVRCYGQNNERNNHIENPRNQIIGAIINIPTSYSEEGKKYAEQWFSSLR